MAHSAPFFFRDEIGEVDGSQIACWRVLKERQLERVWWNRAIPVTFRVIAATERKICPAAIGAGSFDRLFIVERL